MFVSTTTAPADIKNGQFKCPKCNQAFLTFTETDMSMSTFYCVSCASWFAARQTDFSAGEEAGRATAFAAAATAATAGSHSRTSLGLTLGLGAMMAEAARGPVAMPPAAPTPRAHASEATAPAAAAATTITEGLLTPRQIYEGLNEHVIGQHKVSEVRGCGSKRGGEGNAMLFHCAPSCTGPASGIAAAAAILPS